jgi:hypothetical protein
MNEWQINSPLRVVNWNYCILPIKVALLILEFLSLQNWELKCIHVVLASREAMEILHLIW